MAAANKKEAAREKSRAYRARMKAKGYRLVQRWVPDTRTEAFKKMAHEDSLALARADATYGEQDYINAISIRLAELPD